MVGSLIIFPDFSQEYKLMAVNARRSILRKWTLRSGIVIFFITDSKIIKLFSNKKLYEKNPSRVWGFLTKPVYEPMKYI
jgi:hypothetical protein